MRVLHPPSIANSSGCSSLSQDDIPAKLRCAICSKLAVNAFRLPCCEQAICETCQSALPASCPVCEHSPLSAADCKPHKALRTTIKVFLRTEEKKRESSRPKEATTPITPVDSAPVAVAVPAVAEPAPAVEGDETVVQQQPAVVEAAPQVAEDQIAEEISPHDEDAGLAENNATNEVRRQIGRVSMEFVANGSQDQQPHDPTDGEPDASADLVPAQNASEVVEGNAEEAKEGEENGDDQQANPNGVSANGMNGTFPTTGFTPGFDQMQMMMAMQNGFGNFPMMGESCSPASLVSTRANPA